MMRKLIWKALFEKRSALIRDLRDKIGRDAEFAERVAKALGVLI